MRGSQRLVPRVTLAMLLSASLALVGAPVRARADEAEAPRTQQEAAGGDELDIIQVQDAGEPSSGDEGVIVLREDDADGDEASKNDGPAVTESAEASQPEDEPVIAVQSTPTTASYAKDGWVPLAGGGKGYAKGGRLVAGWMSVGSSKYWFDAQGRMATGWTDVDVNGKTMHYYFNPASGNLARGTWMTIDGKKYYFRASGNVAHGWETITDNGAEKKYYFDDDYQMLTGWQDIAASGKTMRYYFRPSGAMATGWAKIDGKQHFFRASGNMATGFTDVPEDSYKRYFDAQGNMVTGWQTIGGKAYFFRSSGAMQTGKATIDGASYEFNKAGVLTKAMDMKLSLATNEVSVGAVATLRCTVENAGGASLGYQWERSKNAVDWESIPGQSTQDLSVKATADSTVYQYRCVVVDQAGNAWYSDGTALRVSSGLPTLQAAAHVQDLAWMNYVGAGEVAGTTGRGLQMEAAKIKLVDGSGASAITYRVHNADAGWSSWRSSGETAGTTGKGLQAEAMEVKLTGDFATLYDVYYRVHVSDVGWIGWAKNGETAGSVGLAKSIEAFQVVLKRKGEAFDAGAAHQLFKPELKYRAHVENVGWQGWVAERATAGTTGQGLRVEAIRAKMEDVYGSGNAIAVRAHCSDVGWMGWVGSGQVAGTTGESRRMECVQINLCGCAACFFDVYYRVHVENEGWLGWAKNGEMAGTTNGARRMEAIQIQLVLKGQPFDTGGVPYIELTPPSNTQARHEAVAYLHSLVGQNCCWHDSTTDCVDVAQYYYDWLGVGARSGNGCDYHTGNLPVGWSRVYSDPQPGDVAAWGADWGSSGYGHVACVVEVGGGSITVVEQSTTRRKNAGHNVPCYYKTYAASSPYSYLRPNF